jgi:oligopeptide transport system substrate-binding protein
VIELLIFARCGGTLATKQGEVMRISVKAASFRLAATGLLALTAFLGACNRASEPPGATAAKSVATSAASEASRLPKGTKVLRLAFEVAETGYDPAMVQDYYSAWVNEAVFDKLLNYDYLARPAKLVPGIVEALPLVENQGKTYTFKVKPGVYFAPDAAFKGVKRELTAQDVVYSYKRHFDDANRPPWRFLLEGKIVGLDALSEQAKKSGKFDYDAPVSGLTAIDKYTLKIELTRTDYNFGFIVAHSSMGIVAREVIEAYRDDTLAHPVGSGPYMVSNWQRRSKTQLSRNPNFREVIWDFAPSNDPLDQEIVKQMKGKRIPAIDHISISVIEEEQARWLAFKNGEIDVDNLPWAFGPSAFPGGKLAPDLAAKGITAQSVIDPEITYQYFNMLDPIWGGYALEKIALRRAVAMAYNIEEEISTIRKGQAVQAHWMIPPGVAGHNPNYRSSVEFNPELANKLLDKFGYKKGADGYRATPDGKAIVFKHNSTPDSVRREYDELWRKNLDRIGIKFEAEKEAFAEALKRERSCQLVTRGSAWIADFPDGENFVSLLYSPNKGESNNACYVSKVYDDLYKQSIMLPDGPQRDAVYLKMQKVMEADTPWLLQTSRKRNQMVYPHVKGYKKHPILHADWMYADVEPK